MPSLRELISARAPLLLLDAASSRIQAGLWTGRGDPRWAHSEEEAGVGLFRCLERVGADPASLGALAFCAGPGSILGIRTAAMALRVWQASRPLPAYGYLSLAVVAHARVDFAGAVIADARRESWHVYRRGQGLSREPASALSGELLMPEGFRHWSVPPPGVRPTPYELERLLPLAADADLFFPAEEPDAYLHSEPSYALWTPHRS